MNQPTENQTSDTIFLEPSPKLAFAIRNRMAQKKRDAALLEASKGNLAGARALYREADAIASGKPQ